MGRKKSTNRKEEVLQVRLDADLARLFRQYCKEGGKTVSEKMRSMIKELDLLSEKKIVEAAPSFKEDENGKSEPIIFRADY